LIASRRAHLVALISGLLFFFAVSGLILAVIVNPDGGVTGGASTLMTLPWSVFTLRVASGTPAIAALTLFFGGINAAILYWVVRGLFRVARFGIALVTLIAVATFVTATVWFFNAQFRDYRVRIIHARIGSGVWIATDWEGLKAMSEIVSMASDAPLEAGKHLVLVPNETRGIYEGRSYLLGGGRLVDPYPANSYDMARDGAVEVERIRITEGPYKGLEGWTQTQDLHGLLTIFAM